MQLIRALASIALGVSALACVAVACGGSSGPVQLDPPDAGGCKGKDSGTATPAESGATSLATLGVTSGSDSSLGLIPDFAPAIHDYYVRCTGNPASPSANELTVTATAPSGGTTSVRTYDPVLGTFKPSSSGDVSVTPGEAIVVTAMEGTAREEYWVRCIPDNFPEMQWTPHADGCARPPGYYLISAMASPAGKPGYAIVLDSNGVPVWYRFNGGALAVYMVETLTPGSIVFTNPAQKDTLSPFQSLFLRAGPMEPDEHDVRYDPTTGHYFAIDSSRQDAGAGLVGFSVPERDCGTLTFGPNMPIYACNVDEFDSSGKVYRTWKATDHFDMAAVWVAKGNGDLAETEAEPFHCNSLDVDPSNGNVLVSGRHMNSVFYVEWSTGKVLWKMGGANSSKDGATYVPVDSPFSTQHDARLLPGWKETCSGGSGQVSVFDDESYSGPDHCIALAAAPARGVVYDVNIAGGCPGSGPKTGGKTEAKLAWEYKNWFDGGSSSNVTGSCRVNADGTRIVGWGQSNPQPNGLVFTEVDEKGNDLLDLYDPDDSSSYRAVKMPLSAFDLNALRASAAHP